MSSTHLAHPQQAGEPRSHGRPDRADIRSDLLIAAALFAAVLIIEIAFVVAFAQSIPADALMSATIT